MSMTLEQLARTIGATLRARGPEEAGAVVVRCARLEDAGPDDLAFLANPKYADQLQQTAAAAVIVSPGVTCDKKTVLVADDPYFAFRNAAVALHGFRDHPAPEAGTDRLVSTQAVIDPTAQVGPGTRVHPFAVVSHHARIGADCVIYPNVFIGPHAVIGDQCVLYPSVTIYDHCVLGDRVTLHAGCVIGQDGFGYATHKGEHHKIPQSGNVVIEDDVEMGANCTVDRATLGSTVIGKGTKFSNLVAIGHGTKVGRHNLYVALVGLAGSVETGDYVAMGGQVGVAGHLKIGHNVQIAATSGVMNNIPDNEKWGGTPAMPLTDAKRSLLYAQRLPDLVDRIKKLERKIEQLSGVSGTDAGKG